MTSELVLRSLCVMHRHGDRAPVFQEAGTNLRVTDEDREFWKQAIGTQEQVDKLSKVGKPSGSSQDPKHGGEWPCGHLTQKGIGQMTQVGRAIRDQYGDFINQTWRNDHVEVLSTNYYRTLQSVQAVLTGLFELDEKDVKEPFVIRTTDEDAMGPTHSMSVYTEMEKWVAKDVEEAFDPEELKNFRQQVRQVIGLHGDEIVGWTAARDLITCNTAHGRPIPKDLDDKLKQRILDMEGWLWHRLYADAKLCHDAFETGVQEVYSRLKNAVEGNIPPELSILSAHDASITALVCALKMDAPTQNPPYGSYLTFEVLEDPSDRAFYIRTKLNGQILHFNGQSEDVAPFSLVQSIFETFLGHSV